MINNKSAEMQDNRLNELETTVDMMEVKSNTSVQVVEGSITKTVASESSAVPSDFDFLNLVDAIDWVNSVKSTETITIELDSGEHYYTDATVQGIVIHTASPRVYIKGNTADFNNHTITDNPVYPLKQSKTVFYTKSNVSLFNIHITKTSTSLYNVGIVAFTSFVNLYHIKISNMFVAVTALVSSHISMGTITITDTQRTIRVEDDTYVTMVSSTIVDLSTRLYSLSGFKNTTCVSIGNTLTNVAEISDIPIDKLNAENTILITDTAIVWTGATLQRPALTAADERPFFDTDLNKPIWFNGTVWVDAVGTTV